VSPSESFTELVVADFEFQTPTSTTKRSPLATLAPVVTAMLLLLDPCALACWTKAGVLDAAMAGATGTVMATALPVISATADMVADALPRPVLTRRQDWSASKVTAFIPATRQYSNNSSVPNNSALPSLTYGDLGPI
jgi:hypothetical protein